MPITRTFIDWSTPLIPAVVERLFERYTVLGVADLRNVVVVFPTRHGLQRFDDLWVRRTKGAGHPPRRITVGKLPELLYHPQRPFASDLVQKLAWGEAVRGLPRQQVELVLGHLPDDGDFDAWLSVGELLWRTHIELAADGLHFSDVAQLGTTLPGFQESGRWQAMHAMQRTYLDTLDGLGLWDQQTARLVAIDRQECRTSNDLILVGAADINVALRRMLDQVADRVTAYIHAPEAWQEAFDAHGCLIPSAWEHVEIELPEEQLVVVDGPADQARQVVASLRKLNGLRRIDEITIAVPDDRLIPVLRRVLGEVDVACHRSMETTLKETSPYSLLMAVAAWLESERPSQFAELVRHPAISDWLAHQGVPPRWLVELDEFQSRHLQSRFGKWPAASSEKYQSLKRAYDLVTALVANLAADSQLLGEWTETITDFLLTLYSHREFDADHPDERLEIEACRRIWLHANQEVPESLMPAVSGYQAIRMTLADIGAVSIPPGSQLSGVELLGWLDLAQDDNPVVVLTSFNEQYIPSSVNSDLFLPNALRQHLGLTDNSRRYARDAHSLLVLLNSRENVSLIVGRRDVRNEPLVPSRLMFAADGETIAARIRRFYDHQDDGSEVSTSPPLELLTERTRQPAGTARGFRIPQPDPQAGTVKKMSVTAFKLYLACPYRFYLRHVLKLKPVEEDALELSPAGFGSLLHEVLQKFGRHPAARSSSESEVRDVLMDLFDAELTSIFGSDPLPVVKIQMEQARQRLKAFSVWQTIQVQDGWQIHHVEQNYGMPFGRTQKIWVSGRIDRIDQNQLTDEIRIIDYKTSDKGKVPDQVHRKSKRWVDLQLPLYRHLAASHGIHGEVQLGYLNLSREGDQAVWAPAEWSDDQLAEADRTAYDVVEKVLRAEFSTRSETAVPEAREFARICQEGVFGREAHR